MTDTPRGFAALSPEVRKARASKGGSSVPAEKRLFTRDRTAAAEAGRKGGMASKRKPNPDPDA